MNFPTILQSRSPRVGQHGLGLVELMVALVLGLLVTGGAIAIFSSNRQTYATTESLGRIQENARIAYELMARDIRAAGGTPCSETLPTANVTYDPATTGGWWQVWGTGIVGYKAGDAGAPPLMKAGSDAIQLMSAEDNPVTIVSHDTSNSKFTLNATPTGFSGLDIAVVCDYRQASIFQIANNGIVGKTISYTKSGLNCTRDLSLPVDCSAPAGGLQYGNDAMLARLRAVQWYVRDNGREGSSLYQRQRMSDGNFKDQEVAEGVSNMKLTYLVNGGTDYVAAASVADWSAVYAVRMSLTLQGGEGQGHVATTGGALTRTLDHVVSIRNHAP